jgi:L-fuculose-phosphate aldolase
MQGKKMKPLLDDFAQLIGPTVKCAVFDNSSANKVVKALGNKNAVLLKDNGAICVAGTKYDAEAIEIVMDKGCKTLVGANLYSGVKAINAIEANLMRIIYKMKYSKKAGK